MTSRTSLTCAVTTVVLLVSTILLLTSFATASEPEPRIVGGQNAEQQEYPYFTGWGRSCGATLIHDDILLTAAHCNPVETNQVIVGAYAKAQPMLESEIRTVERRIIHPDYNVNTWNFDVMLLKLNEPVTTIPKVVLNNNPAIPRDSSTVTPLGLGRLAEVDGEFPEVLQEVNVRVINSIICNSSPMYPGWIQDSMVCAGVLGGGQDACFGDSGGPLLQMDFDTGEMVQVGVVSFGTGCARRDKPGVYHRVSSSYDWIQEQICLHSDNKPSTCPGQVRDVVINPIYTPQRPLTEDQLPLQDEQPQQSEQLQQPQQEEEKQQEDDEEEVEDGVFELFTHPDNPPKLPLGMCEGDCDKDSDCAEGLYCFYKTSGVTYDVPGCEGNDLTSTDFCVDNKHKMTPTQPPVRQSIFKANNGLRGGTSRGTFNRNGEFGALGVRRGNGGILEGVLGSRIP